MENEHTINALQRKRSEIAGQIEQCQSRMRGLVIDLDHVDASLRLFDPQIDFKPPPARGVPSVAMAFRGEITRIMVAAFKEAGTPITSDHIVERVMLERGLNPSDLKTRKVLIGRIGAALYWWRRRGLIRECPPAKPRSGTKYFKSWTLVHRDADFGDYAS